MNSNGLSRRAFVKGLTIGAMAISIAPPTMAGSASPRLTISDLPKGSAPAPLLPAHFPDRLHTFVWRNWSLVPARVMARVVGAKTSEILDLGRAMGLGAQPRISRDQQSRSRLTVIRRNWHLLPYSQMLDLLGWSPDEMDYALREDDFLFVKLGMLKPNCEPLRYHPPDETAIKRQREIARILSDQVPGESTKAQDPLFGFVKRLSDPPARKEKSGQSKEAGALRFCYSYFALYGDPLLEPDPDPYPDGYLARLSQTGVNGVWLQAVLHKLAPFPWDPERSRDHSTRLRNLRRLVKRAGRHNIKIFLYLNEPRAMPERFYERYPELKGVSEAGYAALCTSNPSVQKFLVDSVESICRAVPGLGGFFTISASENLTNCWSHGSGGAKCPRCGTRPPADVIAEVNRLFAEGIRKAGSDAQFIAWDWGWNDTWAPEAIRGLAPKTSFMSVSEWRLPIERGGVKSTVGEYSISSIGPGPRADAHWKIASERGLKTVAKIQAGNSWELSAVPYIPALENVARHAANLHQRGVEGVMLGWTLGGYPSPNLEVAAEALGCGSADEAMVRVAERRFGPFASSVLRAWRRFSSAFSQFPYHGTVLYNAPQQLGPANLLWGEPTGYRATMTGFPYDDLTGWRAIYPEDVFVQLFDTVAEGFKSGCEQLESETREIRSTNVLPVSETHRAALAAEKRVANAVAIHFKSVANQAGFLIARQRVAVAKSSAEAVPHLDNIERLLKDEIDLARQLHSLQTVDSRFGFEASNQYFYIPMDLAEKVLNCQDLLTRWLPGMRTRFENSAPPLPRKEG
jgi:hypothetical protein